MEFKRIETWSVSDQELRLWLDKEFANYLSEFITNQDLISIWLGADHDRISAYSKGLHSVLLAN